MTITDHWIWIGHQIDTELLSDATIQFPGKAESGKSSIASAVKKSSLEIIFHEKIASGVPAYQQHIFMIQFKFWQCFLCASSYFIPILFALVFNIFYLTNQQIRTVILHTQLNPLHACLELFDYFDAVHPSFKFAEVFRMIEKNVNTFMRVFLR